MGNKTKFVASRVNASDYDTLIRSGVNVSQLLRQHVRDICQSLNPENQNSIIANLAYWFGRASNSQIVDGLHWYDVAHNLAYDTSVKYGLSLKSCAYAIAALSPMLSWDRNKSAFLHIANIVANDGNAEDCYGIGTINGNAHKAFYILRDNNISHCKGLKVNAFAQSIYTRGACNAVTVDVWMLRASYNDLSLGGRRIGKAEHNEITNSVLTIGDKSGIAGAIAQAIIWLSIRDYAHEIRGNRYTAQYGNGR